MEKLKVDSIKVSSTVFKRPVLKQIEDTIKFLITTELNYRTPSDRGLHFEVLGNVTKAKGGCIDLVINIIPSFLSTKKDDKLRKYIVFKTELYESDWVNDLQKELNWVLDYFGLTIMYITKEFRIIEISKEGKGYTLEYKS